MSLAVTPCTMAAIRHAAAFPQLAAEIEDERSVPTDATPLDGTPSALPDWDECERLEAAGQLFSFGAAIGGALIGFVSVRVSRATPHATPLATTASVFIADAHRDGAAEHKLLAAAEAKALECGCAGLIVSAPAGGWLDEALPRRGYAATSRTWCKGFGRGALVAPPRAVARN